MTCDEKERKAPFLTMVRLTTATHSSWCLDAFHCSTVGWNW